MAQVGRTLEYRFGDIGQKVQDVEARTVSAASEKWLQLTYYLMT